MFDLEIIDITSGVFGSEVYPGDPESGICTFKSFEKGDGYNLNAFSACAHAGTHVDAPLHFIEDGLSVDRLPLQPFIGPCRVISVPEGPITGEFVEMNFPRGCRRVLIKGNKKAYFMDHAAYAAAQLEYFLIGTDALSVGEGDNQMAPHKAFLNKGISILEGLDLSGVEEGSYFLIAPPIKLEGLEAAPARAILVKDSFSWGKR